jgi:hypothetical protein
MDLTITIPDERVARIDERLKGITYNTPGPEPNTTLVRPQYPNGTQDWVQQTLAQQLDQVDPAHSNPVVQAAMKAAEDAIRQAEFVRKQAVAITVVKKT